MSYYRRMRRLLIPSLLLAAACAHVTAPSCNVAPAADHHQHLVSAAGYLAGYFTRGEGEAKKHFGEVQMSLRKGADGAWRIAAETPTFPGPTIRQEYNAEQLIAKLDAAGIRRAAVLSTAYWFG